MPASSWHAADPKVSNRRIVLVMGHMMVRTGSQGKACWFHPGAATVAFAGFLDPPYTMADDAIIFTDKAGRTVTRAELDSPESVLGWKGVDEDVPAEAVKLHSEGRTHAEGGDINKAIENFEAAAELAPNWPHPVYDCAVAHLMMDLYGESLDLFEKVESMEPEGFVGTKAAVWSLQREKNGELPRGVFKAYM